MGDYYWKLRVRTGRKYDPGQPRVPAGDSRGGQWTASGSLSPARRKLEGRGVQVAETPKDAVELMADAFAEKWGWDANHTREGFVKNQRRLLEDSKWPPEEYRDRVLSGAETAIESGRAGPLPIVVRGMREGYNDAWSTGVHEGTHVEFIYNPKRPDARPGYRPEEVQKLGENLSVSSSAYENPFEGTYIHEWGHHVTTPQIERRAASVIDDRRDFIKKNLSRYATENARELAAEAYSLSVHPDFSILKPEAQQLITWILEGD